MARIKVAIIVLADTTTHEGMGRVANALEAVKEFKEAKDEVQLIFDGGGTTWIPELSKPDNKLHGLYESVRDKVAGVCSFCAGAFEVTKSVKDAKVPLLSEFEGHPSFRRLLVEGYQIITF